MDVDFISLGSLVGSAIAAFFAGRTSRRTKGRGGKSIAQLVEELVARNRRRTAVFLRAHVESWTLEHLLKEIVAAEFEEAEREDIFRRKQVWEGLE